MSTGSIWRYEQSTGRAYWPSGTLLGVGYAGTGAGRNNHAMQDVRNIGPLPCGRYTLRPPIPFWDGTGAKPKHKKLGAWPVIPLEPLDSNEMYGRSAFLIHGDNAAHDASEGCIILGPMERNALAKATGDTLEVIP